MNSMKKFWKDEPEIIKAAVIQEDFRLAGYNYANNLRIELGLPPINLPPQIQNRSISSNNRDLINTNNTNNERRRKFNLDAITFLSEVIDILGEDTFLISYNKFFELLEKYNLVCGELRDYSGDIPRENLNTITKNLEILNKAMAGVVFLTYKIDNYEKETDISGISQFKIKTQEASTFVSGFPRIKKIHRISLLSNVKEENLPGFSRYAPIISRFPFMIEGIFLEEGFNCTTFFDFGEYQINNFNVTFGDQGLCGSLQIKPCDDPVFIAAPITEMNQVLKLERVKNLIPEDPFVISLTKYGVLIHTMWGVETKDETVGEFRGLVRKLVKIKQLIKS